MSEKKTVTFQASTKPKKVKKKIEVMQDAAEPNQIAMPVRDDGMTEEDPEAFQNLPLRDRDHPDEQFPTDALQLKDKGDVLLGQKLAAREEGKPGVTPFGQLIAKDSDFELLRKKRDLEAYANFQLWFAKNYDRMSPEQKAIARELFPTFYRERLRTADKAIEMQRRLVHQKIEGIKTKEDLLFQYAVEAGLIDSEAVENILHPEKAARARSRANAVERYQRGLFNPRRLIRGDFGTGPRSTNATDLLGKSYKQIGDTHQFGTGSHGFSAFPGLEGDAVRSRGLPAGVDEEQDRYEDNPNWEGFTNFSKMMESFTPFMK